MGDHPSMSQASSPAAVDLGHSCLSIENYGFNETTNRWAADHIYRHLPMAHPDLQPDEMLDLNLFYVFFHRGIAGPEVNDPRLKARALICD